MKNKGASLVDYIIPTAVIGLVLGLGIYTVLDNNKLLNFIAGSGKMDVSLYDGTVSVGEQLEDYMRINPGSLGGTPDNPVTKCTNNNCILDFGDFVLTGLPENFNEYVASNGTSGGTEKLISLLNQMAYNLQINGESAKAQELRDIANLSHFMAKNQELLEDNYNRCSQIPNNVEKITCVKSFYSLKFDELNIDIPSEVSTLVPEMTSDMKLSNFFSYNRPLVVDQYKKYNYDYANYGLTSDKGLLLKLDDLKDHMNADTTYSPQMVTVANKLIKSTYDLISRFELISKPAVSVDEYGVPKTVNTTPYYRINPTTGEEELVSGTREELFDDFNTVLHPETSLFTNFNARLTCKTGHWNTTLYKCQ